MAPRLTLEDRRDICELLTVAAQSMRSLVDEDALHVVCSVPMGDRLYRYAARADALREKIGGSV